MIDSKQCLAGHRPTRLSWRQKHLCRHKGHYWMHALAESGYHTVPLTEARAKTPGKLVEYEQRQGKKSIGEKTMYCVEFCARKMPRTEIRVLPRTKGADYISKRRSNDPCQLLNPTYPSSYTGHSLLRKLVNKAIYSLLHPRFL